MPQIWSKFFVCAGLNATRDLNAESRDSVVSLKKKNIAILKNRYSMHL